MNGHKLQFELVPFEPGQGIIYRTFNYDVFDIDWHFHPEYELTYIKRGEGKRIVGDKISDFYHGDLVLIGSNLPHLWKEEYTSIEAAKGSECCVIQFHREIFNDKLLSFSELLPLKKLLFNSQRGIYFKGSKLEMAAKLIQEMKDLQGLKVYVKLVDILLLLVEVDEYELLSSEGYQNIESEDCERFNLIFKYILNNYASGVKLEEAAELVNLSKSAFCNYFKRKTNKNFSKYVNELRISRACKLLQETDMNISEICYEIGFSNLSYFNREFLSQTQYTPKQFRKLIN